MLRLICDRVDMDEDVLQSLYPVDYGQWVVAQLKIINFYYCVCNSIAHFWYTQRSQTLCEIWIAMLPTT